MLTSRVFHLVLGIIIVFLDQWTKYLIRSNFVYGESIPIIHGFFNLVYVQNDGAAWNILSGQRVILIFISLAVLLFLIIKKYSLFINTRLHNIIYGLLLGGIIGNLIDRIRFGWVIDFIDLQFGSYHYPSFNVADSAICIGAILYIISSYIYSDKKDKLDG